MSLIATERASKEPGNLLRDAPLRRAIGSTIRPYRWGIFLLGLSITGATILPLVQPLVLRAVIDRLIEGHSFQQLVPFAIAVALLPLATAGLTYVYTYRASRPEWTTSWSTQL